MGLEPVAGKAQLPEVRVTWGLCSRGSRWRPLPCGASGVLSHRACRSPELSKVMHFIHSPGRRDSFQHTLNRPFPQELAFQL